MDTLGALALATEPPTDHLMDRSPVGRRSHFLIFLIITTLNHDIYFMLLLGYTVL